MEKIQEAELDFFWKAKSRRIWEDHTLGDEARFHCNGYVNTYPTAFPYGKGMVLHFYKQQESSTTKTVHKVINKRLKTYV